MGRLASWVKYRTEWEAIRAERRNGSILDRNTTSDESKLIPDPSASVEQRFKWMPSQLSAGLGLSRIRFYSEQSTCPLFKLPVELRLAIWEYVVGGNDVTVVRKVDKIGHVVLSRDAERLKAAQTNVNDWSNWGPVGRERRYTVGEVLAAVDLLAMLRSCKRVYIEALPVLYGYNAFEFRTMESFYRFLRQSPATGLQFVRSVRIAWSGFAWWQNYERPGTDGTELEYEESWREICDAVVAMKGLRVLNLHSWSAIDLRWQETSRDDMVRKILAPLGALPEGVDLTFTCSEVPRM